MSKSEEHESITIKLPFYKQSQDFTCGAACLLMAMGAFDKKIELTQESEIDIWRESNLVELYGTCRYGLALSAWKRGFSPRIVSNSEGILYECIIEECNLEVDREMLRFFFEDMRTRCKIAGICEERGTVTVEIIKEALIKREIPIVLSNALMVSDEDIPHWVVVSGFEADKAFVNNPLNEMPEIVDIENFKKGIGYKGKSCMISVTPRMMLNEILMED